MCCRQRQVVFKRGRGKSVGAKPWVERRERERGNLLGTDGVGSLPEPETQREQVGEKQRERRWQLGEDQEAAAMADMTERLAVARKKAEALKSEIAKAQNDKKDCSIQEAAAQIDLKNLGPGLKARRVLKGHFGKVYAMHWSGDNQNLVSASQVSLFCVLLFGFACASIGCLFRVRVCPVRSYL